jgi:hypothetical protein
MTALDYAQKVAENYSKLGVDLVDKSRTVQAI